MQNPRYPIFIADDIKTNLLFLKSCLTASGYNHIIMCQDSPQVMDFLSRYPSEIILLDLRMPQPDGLTLLPKIRQTFPEVPVIIVTDISDVKTAVKCMREGAFDYITKPIDRDLLRITVNRAVAFRQLQRENQELKKPVHGLEDLQHPEAFSSIITANPAMYRIFHYMESVAESPEPVLVTGDTGVGKELVARVIHTLSGRSGDLIPVNVAGLDDTMFSDTLFGHVPGAFSGADQVRKGLVETAAAGTLFLDEIGDLSHQSQVKLLRLIQENEYMPLGQDKTRHCSARIVVATNADLWALEKKGRFRKDLIFRLNTHHVHLPLLSERKGDLPLLLNHFMDQACAQLKRDKPTVSKAFLARLGAYAFPGNIRELRMLVFDAISRCEDHVLSGELLNHRFKEMDPARDTPSKTLEGMSERLMFPETLPSIKAATDLLVQEAMSRTDGNQTLAAAMLGISQPALNKRLKKMTGGPECQESS